MSGFHGFCFYYLFIIIFFIYLLLLYICWVNLVNSCSFLSFLNNLIPINIFLSNLNKNESEIKLHSSILIIFYIFKNIFVECELLCMFLNIIFIFLLYMPGLCRSWLFQHYWDIVIVIDWLDHHTSNIYFRSVS